MDLEELKKRKLYRNTAKKDDEPEELPPINVSAGAIDRVLELAFNPSKEKLREVTVIDRLQGRLLPQLDLVNSLWTHVIEIATYRQSSDKYKELYKKDKPTPPPLLDEFMYRTAQWQKSIAGKNLERAIDMSLAEIESKSMEDDGYANAGDEWGKE